MKRALADVLWEAANLWLSPDANDRTWASANGGQCAYSCHAIYAASLGRSSFESVDINAAALVFAGELGCDYFGPDIAPYTSSNATRQGVRYMWLLLAACVAADEGIEIEVPA